MNIWEQCNERRELRKPKKPRKPVKRQADQMFQTAIKNIGSGEISDQTQVAENTPLNRPGKKPKKSVNPFLMPTLRTLQ